MRISIKTQHRKSIAYNLSPKELTILLPHNVIAKNALDSLRFAMSNANTDISANGSVTKGELRELSRIWASKLEVKPNRVQVRNIRSKWASCSSSRNIVFNEALQNMPREFVEYVICHELLHLKVPKHNKLFRSLLTAYLPDWRDRISRTIASVLKGGD